MPPPPARQRPDVVAKSSSIGPPRSTPQPPPSTKVMLAPRSHCCRATEIKISILASAARPLPRTPSSIAVPGLGTLRRGEPATSLHPSSCQQDPERRRHASTPAAGSWPSAPPRPSCAINPPGASASMAKKLCRPSLLLLPDELDDVESER